MGDERLLSAEPSRGRVGHLLTSTESTDDATLDMPADLLRDDLRLPELGELDVVRHFTHLSSMNFSIDNAFYPLGSCTMKYNPKVNEDVRAAYPAAPHVPARGDGSGRAGAHAGAAAPPLRDQRLRGDHDAAAAGAQAELWDALIRAYHRSRGDHRR